jgi:hypothetical protein
MIIVRFTRLALFLAAASLAGCAATEKINVAKALPPLPPACKPVIYSDNNSPPAGYKVVGLVEYGDSGLSVECSKDMVMERMRQQACKAGANGILVKKVKGPGLELSTCYRVEAELISIPGARSE